MDFHMEATLPPSAAEIWAVLVDVPRIAACIPGCEQVEELARLSAYSCVIKQKVGPFKLEVPAEIQVEECREPDIIRVRASGRDKLTRTTVDVSLAVELVEERGIGTQLVVSAAMQVAGRLASLGYAVIKKKAEQNFAEFEKRFLAQLETV